MKNARLYLILFLSIYVGVGDVLAQFPDISKSFGTYKAKFPASRLHLVFNQPSYAAGDTIFFSAWHLGEDQKYFPGRQVASLDLMADNGEAVKRIHFKIEDGRAYNQLALPKDLDPGSYTIVAYTNWMRNFSDEWFFRKRIEIKSRNEIIAARLPMIAGVEGGNLVAGISNHVAVSADFPGAIVTIRNQSNDEVASASLDSTGVASISIIPRAGDQYTVHGPNNTKTQLPSVKEDGVAMTLSGDTFTLTSAGQYKDRELRAVFTSQGEIVDTRRVRFSDGETTINAPLDMAGKFHQVFLIDQEKNVVAERVFTSDDIRKGAGSLSGPPEVFQREKVSMTVDLPSMSDISVTAYQRSLFETSSLKQSFYLSELPELLQWAEKFPKHEQSLNAFLVTQHWSRINWPEIFSDKEKTLAFPFYDILTGKGLVRSRTTGEPAPDSTNVIVYLQKNTMGYDTYTQNGRFEIPYSFDFWETDYLFVSMQRGSEDLSRDFEVVFTTDSISIPAITPGRQLTSPNVYGNYSANKQLISNSYSFFAKPAANTADQRGLNAVLEDELGEIDVEVDVEKYVVFPSMEDLVREVIPYVQFRKKGMAEGVRMMLQYPTGNRVSKGNPLFVVDGVMTRDVDFFMKLKPKDILTVKISNDPRNLLQLGKIGENGVLLVESKRGTLADSLRDAANILVTGLNRPVAFHNVNPAESAKSQRVPDLRSTLFWQPKVKTENTGQLEFSFVAGDDVGPVTIVVQGLTSDGDPFFLEREVNVKFRRQE